MWRDVVRKMFITSGFVKRPDFTVQRMSRHPSPRELLPGKLILVMDHERAKWACFVCPGGCGNRFQLSLNASRRPSWNVTVDWLMRPDISPSIHQLDSCKAHFFVRGGNVDWCKDSGHQLNKKPL
ncbi:DUF6527 family protein [Pseudomonas ogarae]|uniref:DUF6527 family protein n=1 Tax=Pseudomonas ogarae (strain DSM 112162 / CECT 30235 / F113) TaxID=1114970 RepID=UPI00399F81BC